MTDLSEPYVDKAIEQRTDKIWALVRKNRNSLDSCFFRRKIIELVNLKFSHYFNVVEKLQGEVDLLKSRCDRRNQTIRELKDQLKAMSPGPCEVN